MRQEIFEKERRKAVATMIGENGEIENFCFLAEVTPLKNAYELTVLFADMSKDFADKRVGGTRRVAQGRG